MALHILRAAALLYALPITFAQKLMPESSFGHSDRLSQDGRQIPGWTISATGFEPQILSDRFALTPVYPGNTRGAIWSDNSIQDEHWTIELEFRVNGQEQSSGNIVFWYAQNKEYVAQNSIYTVGNFDGMGIIIDQYGGQGGSIRGFLNDGSQNFAASSTLDSLAFGHCSYAYRNLGRPSKLRVSSSHGLSIFIDDRLCFHSEQISLPAGYHFGVTAASAENPDSVELFKFTTLSGPTSVLGSQHEHRDQDKPQMHQNQLRSQLPGAPEALPDSSADDIKSTDAQFADLHNRLQALQHQIADMNTQFDNIAQKLDAKASEIVNVMPQIPHEALNRLHQRIESTERIVQAIQRDVEGRDYKEHFNELQEAMANVRGGLTDVLPESLGKIVTASTPRMGLFLFVLIAVQVMLAGAYIVYKKRRASAPKKYL